MPFITTEDVAEYLKITDTPAIEPHIDLAEALIAEALGTHTLEERTVTEVKRLPRTRNTIETAEGPIANQGQIVSVQVTGYSAMDLDDVKLPNFWAIGRNDDFPDHVDITLQYLAGFADDDSSTDNNLPRPIKKALIVTAADLYMHPDKRKVSEKIGDYSYQLQGANFDTEPQTVPDLAMKLIRRWVRPNY